MHIIIKERQNKINRNKSLGMFQHAGYLAEQVFGRLRGLSSRDTIHEAVMNSVTAAAAATEGEDVLTSRLTHPLKQFQAPSIAPRLSR